MAEEKTYVVTNFRLPVVVNRVNEYTKFYEQLISMLLESCDIFLRQTPAITVIPNFDEELEETTMTFRLAIKPKEGTTGKIIPVASGTFTEMIRGESNETIRI